MKRLITITLIIMLLSLFGICFAQDHVLSQTEEVIASESTTSFSFASDDVHQGPTFKGARNYIQAQVEVDLVTDLNGDNYGGLVTFLALMDFKGELYDYQAFYIGSQWLHVWKVYAEIQFTHVNPPPNASILTVAFKEGVLSSWSPNSDTIGETMTLQNSESADQSIYMMAHPSLSGAGDYSSYDYNSEDIAFTFTNVRVPDTLSELVRIDKSGNLMEWCSEGSFSASVRF